MEQNLSLKVKRFSACEETPHILWNPNSLPRLQVATTSPFPKPENASMPPMQLLEDPSQNYPLI